MNNIELKKKVISILSSNKEWVKVGQLCYKIFGEDKNYKKERPALRKRIYNSLKSLSKLELIVIREFTAKSFEYKWKL